MKRIIFLLLIITSFVWGNNYKLSSPDSRLEIRITVNKTINYEVFRNGDKILVPSQIALYTTAGQYGIDSQVKNEEIKTVDQILYPVVPEKSNEIRNYYNHLMLEFNKFNLEFRAFNDGVAYRFITKTEKNQKILQETIEYNFSGNPGIWFPEEESMYTHQEREYIYMKMDTVEDKFCSLPTLVDHDGGQKIFISESDLFDYPGFYLTGSEKGLRAIFPNFPAKTEQTSDRDVIVRERENYLTETKGSRSFPWRLMIIGTDKTIIESQLVYQLARECQLKNTDWIKPGKVAWDWWNALNIKGVDFTSGVNTATYKYYMDFAAKYGIEYIILDEGWYDLENVMKVNPEVDMDALSHYSRETGVGLILWVTWKAFYDNIDEALIQFKKWDAKGIKVDFMQRDDQWMVNYYEMVARKAAEHQMLVDFHGSYKPAGLRRVYPNVITREGVQGLEQAKWSKRANPEMAVTLPFIRNVAGPMDYTPGGMRNATENNFHPVYTKPMTMGTRCHQLAMYVIYESPLQMLADNPSHYYAEPQCMEFLSAVPTVWDNTTVLEAKVGDYVVMVRQAGNEYYLGGMTDWTQRDFDIDLNFLGEGNYDAFIYQDGVNAAKNAEDFKKLKKVVSAEQSLKIKLAPGGGFVVRFVPVF